MSPHARPEEFPAHKRNLKTILLISPLNLIQSPGNDYDDDDLMKFIALIKSLLIYYSVISYAALIMSKKS